MAIAFNTPISIANATARAGDQTNAKVAALSNGGFVVAWDSLIAGDASLGNVFFQVFSATGAPVGAATAVSGQPQNHEKLQDITANANGTFTVAYLATGSASSTTVAPSGFGALGAFTQIGVVRNFTNAGAVQGNEAALFSAVGSGATHELVNSIVLQSDTANSNVAYFTQRDATTLDSAVLRSNTILTTPPAVIAASILKTFAAPPTEILALDTARQSPSSDLLTLTGRFLFSDNAASEKLVSGVTSTEQVLPSLYLALRTATSTNGVSGFGFQGAGTQASLFAQSGNVQNVIAGLPNVAGTLLSPKIEAIGGNRFFVAFGFDDTSGVVGDGIYGTVFNASTLEFEHNPVQILPFVTSSFDIAVLPNGRVIVGGNRTVSIGANDIETRIVDASDPAFATRTGFGASESVHAASFANDALGVRVDLENSSQNTGAAALFQPSEINFYSHFIGGTNADSLFGNSDFNILKGLNGADILFGRAGNDQLFGGDGDDIADGGAGEDLIDGGIGNDTLRGGANNDVMFGRLGTDKLNGDDGNDTLNGDENADSVHGGSGEDTVNGGADNDVLSGGAGNDFVDGGSGNDTILAGQGRDTINGGLGIDTVNYLHFSPAPLSSVGVFADLSGVDDFDGLGVAGLGATPVEPSDTLVFVENAFGTTVNDILIGSAVSNRLGGGAGNDLIFGRGGADALSGDAGVDFFRWDAPTEGGDTIFSYNVGEDKLLFLSAAFADTAANNIAARLVKNATGLASAASAQFILNTTTGQLNFDADGTGAGAANAIALIKFGVGTTATFASTDFLFI